MKKWNAILLLLFLILRIFVVNIFNILIPEVITDYSVYIEACFFILIILLVITNSGSLEMYNIDKITLICILLSILIPRYSLLELPKLLIQIFYWISGIGLLVYFIKRLLPVTPLRIRLFYWIIISVIASIIISIPLTLLTRNIYHQPNILYDSGKMIVSGLMIPIYSLYFFSISILSEEIVFRGFLWGVLRECQISEKRIFIISSFLFWISHINYYDRPFSFWIVVPLVSMFLGWITYKSKSCSPPFFGHVIINAVKVAFG